MRSRLLLPIKEILDGYRFKDTGIILEYQFDQFDEIFKYLEKKHGNLIDNNVVSIIGSSESNNLNVIID